MSGRENSGDRGFTLVELIVSVAILGILSVALVGFLASAANTYSSVSSNINLQYESQLTMGQVQEYMIDCDGGICYIQSASGSTLYLMNRSATGLEIHAFIFDASAGTLTYEGSTASPGEGAPVLVAGESGIVSERVTDFDVDINAAADGRAESADVTISFAHRNKTYTGTQTVSLRNGPAAGNDSGALIAQLFE